MKRLALADKIRWLDAPETHDYPAALDYLKLHFPTRVAKATVAHLMEQPVVHFKAKDILRASGLQLLPPSNGHVSHNMHKIQRETRLSPILLVRGMPLIVADGFHRLCAIYDCDEDAEIPCQISCVVDGRELAAADLLGSVSV